MQKFEVPVKEFKRSHSPYLDQQIVKYTGFIHVNDVPEGIPMQTNPREQNLNKKTPQLIEESLLSNDHHFFALNRGMVISADEVSFDNRRKERGGDGLMTFIIRDENVHGNIDGGHTYKLVLRNKGRILGEGDEQEKLDQYVSFEIWTGVEDIIVQLAGARNTSTQVDEKALAELAGKFDIVKKALNDEPFFNRIAFKQFEHTNERGLRVIDARDVVAIMSMVNIDEYSDTKHPVVAYNNKKVSLENYLEASRKNGDSIKNPYVKMQKIAPDIFEMYNIIEKDLPLAYNATGGKYGLKTFAGVKKDDEGNFKVVAKQTFGDEGLNYKVDRALVYPIIAAFRALVEEGEDGYYHWKIAPKTVWEKLKGQLSAKIIREAEGQKNNLTALGKHTNSWDLMYMTVAMFVQAHHA